jgi:hypothetical protein
LDLKHRSGSQSPPTFPAFTFNTTAVETGGRFLLANYVNNEDESSPNGYQSREGVLPAESFLAAYGQAETKHASADIQLVTAARLSGTFPYVSSAARIDPAFAPQADHFVDGGYFDNDGTSSAIEFLEAAFANPISDPIPVLFIEIRDGPDLNPNISDESFASQQSLLANQSPWGMFNQILAPPKGFWQSGHVSVTRRDRRELERLMDSLKDRASFKHIVFDYTDPVNAKEPLKVRRRPSAQPLSWHLTPSQIANVNTSIGELQPCLAQVIEWAHLSLSSTPQSNEPSVSCNHSQALKSVPSP